MPGEKFGGNMDADKDEDSSAFGRRFKHALIAYAVIEFVVLAFVVFYVATR
jgi:hypothetical protein